MIQYERICLCVFEVLHLTRRFKTMISNKKIVIAAGLQKLQHSLGAGHGQLLIAEDYKSGNGQRIVYRADGQ